MSNWTTDAVLALAPDASSAKSAQGLANARQWLTLGRDDISIWGEIKGSGATPYQARIDLREPAFKCSCPSRKFPCKHGLALFLVRVREEGAFTAQAAPQWVTEWIAGRTERTDRKESARTDASEPDPVAKARRTEQRDKRIDGGVDQLHLWMGDLVRMGLASARTQPSDFWRVIASRLVDAQAPGLGRLVRRLEEDVQSGPGWEDRAMVGIARLELLRSAMKRASDLPPELAADVRAAVGIATGQEQLSAVPDVADCWLVLGWTNAQEDRLTVRRTWLHGMETQRSALLLDFAIGSQAMAAPMTVGKAFDATLAFHPFGLELRAAIRHRGNTATTDIAMPGLATLVEALSNYADALARCPWLDRYPLRLGRVRAYVDHSASDEPSAFLLDADDSRIRLPRSCLHGWHLMAISGGREIGVFGEWDGETLNPLSAYDGTRWYAMNAGSPRLQKL